jgi:CubicO group peptidase (beta-lactamase class C family)
VSAFASVDRWPGDPSFILFRLVDGVEEHVAYHGDLDEVRSWASVSKMVVSMACGVECDWGLHDFDERLGPRGASLANLLSHTSGLGLEAGDPIVGVATKRVYSNVAVDLAVEAVVGDSSPAAWLDDRIFRTLGMPSTSLQGRPSSGVVGSTRDMMTLAVAWLRSDGIARVTRDRLITPYLAHLDGIVPGFGRFSPCPWGLGPEVRGAKQHWMGDWPESSFGHFGQSGSLMLLNADEQIGLVATSTVAFGSWAVELWPSWTGELRRSALPS